MREKLIELLWGNHNDHPSAFSGLTDEFEHEVDYLIAHGVTIREKGEWKVVKDNTLISPCYECSLCGRRVNTFGLPEDTVPFCHCGADMRGEQK